MILSTNALSLWKHIGANTDEALIILSPYLTGSICLQILEADTPASIYTRFEIELFATRSSDLQVLSDLLDAGHNLYHLDDLHAKVVLSPGDTVSIGSQNLTSKGTRNLELSAFSTEDKDVTQAYDFILPWLTNATPITADMISDMADLLPPLLQAYDEFSVACKSAMSAFDRMQADRRTDVRMGSLAFDLTQAPTAREWVKAEVQYRFDSFQTSLVSRSYSLLSWTFNDECFCLKRLHRYMVITATGKIGWARVAKTRISMIGRVIIFTERGIFPDRPDWKLAVQSNLEGFPYVPSGTNIMATIAKGRKTICRVPIFFSLTSCDSGPPIFDSTNDSKLARLQSDARSWLETNHVGFDDQLFNVLTKPFFYSEHLHGEDASFFGKPYTDLVVRAIKTSKHPVLSVTPALKA